MRIQHNLQSMNAYRNYSGNASVLNKHLEKLSSGYQINRSADDAAGLAISEKMRFQITGLNQGVKNAKDGISLCQTAEGALQEVHELLRRMKELSIQAANGTYDGLDRGEIQKEIDQTVSEIDRISEASNFNGRQLFNGGSAATGAGGATGTPETPDVPDVPEPDPPEEPETTTVTCGDFTITTAGKAGIDYSFEDGVLTIFTEQAITIKNTDGVDRTSNRIVIKKDVNANITLSGVNINSDSEAAFEIEEGSTGDVTLALEGNNMLKSGRSYAGLQKNGGADTGKLVIQGNGQLTAAGGLDAAGIGGGSGKSGSNIIIESGTVNAVGGEESNTSRGGGAGIGGGHQRRASGQRKQHRHQRRCG